MSPEAPIRSTKPEAMSNLYTMGMKFHVTRGDEFICDVLIVNVDTEKAVGVLELVQQSPKVGDNASTNL